MSKELIVSSGRHETRVAILEDDQVVELFHEREKEYSLAGSIHKGCVTRVLPGMQSAFVDIGLDRDAFLYVSDFFEDNDEYEAVVSTVEEKVLKLEKTGGLNGAPAERSERSEPVSEAVGSAAPEVSATAPAEAAQEAVRPETDRGAHPDRGGENRGGDRGGGRGRRGRRRRGGRASGLPDSKFFSPRSEGAAAPPVEVETAGGEIEAETEVQPPQTFSSAPRATRSDDDFFVLPGESLAKYTSDDSHEAQSHEVQSHEVQSEEAGTDEEPSEPAEDLIADSSIGGTYIVAIEPVAIGIEPPAAEEPVASVEAALPEEHPLAGFGAIPSWVNPEADPNLVEEIVPEEKAPEAEAAQQVEYSGETGFSTKEETPDEADEGLSASEVVESELTAEALATPEVLEDGGAVQEDGPEPARIPTSLTAALREQGHRYPHRVSRRMRRKMRGGQGEDREKQPSDGEPAADARVENKTVAAPREDRRPDFREQREQRGGRERSERERPERERPERERPERERPERERPPLPSISDLLKEGQEIIVQIAKEPLGQKGARITSHIALPGRFVVYMPTVEHVGVSRKIPSDDERQRLKRVLQTHRQGIPGGFICRTAAENKSEEELRSDMHFLYNLWLDMRQKAEKKPAPVLLHHDLDLVQRILRDQLTTSFKTIWVDNEELFESILSFVQRFQPALVGRVKLYTRTNPIFDEFGITNEVEKALRPKVWLKSGGYIVINQTEALVAIDINTGKYVGKSNRLEDTIVKINTDAIKEIVRQIRLRDLGGIIVVDFIDMDERKNRQKVMLALEESMRADRAPYKILQFNDFGLVAITRKRVKQSLERTLCSPCPYCEGAGYIKSVGTVISEVLQEAQKMRRALETEQSNIVLRVNPEVARVLKSNQNSFLQEIEEIIGKSVLVKSDPLLHQTKFDLA